MTLGMSGQSGKRDLCAILGATRSVEWREVPGPGSFGYKTMEADSASGRSGIAEHSPSK
jgi:hypothetical protein